MSYTTPDFIAPAKATLDAALRAATIASDGAAKLYDLNTKTARAMFDEITGQIQTLASAKDPAELRNLAAKVAKPDFEKGQAYARAIYDQIAATQSELAAAVENQVAEFNKQIVVALDSVLKSAPAGSEPIVSAVKSAMATVNESYESAVQSWKTFGQQVESTVASVTPAAVAKRKAA